MTSDLTFGLLGELDVRRGEARVPVRRATVRTFLAALLLDAGSTVSYEKLIDALWGSNPPSSARTTVHVYANRLRAVLSDHGPELQIVQTRSNGYLLDVDRENVDALQFIDRVRAASRVGAAADSDRESELLRDALALWRGTPLADIPSDFLQQSVAWLNEERVRAFERRVTLDLTSGRHAEVLSELVSLTQEHPAREQLRELHMRALLLGGRRAEALKVYQDLWQYMRDELGIEPSDKLRRLQTEILTGEARPHAGAPDVPAALLSAVPPGEVEPAEVIPAQLPLATHRFVGREAHFEEAVGRLVGSASPLTIVSGPPGVGKTTFAVHAAKQARSAFPDGQLYVNLGGYSAGNPLLPEVVLARFLGALGVPAGQVPADLDDQVALYRSVLADRRVVIVLDNAADPEQVRPILPGYSRAAVLVTSRNDLRGLVAIDGGHEIALAPLRASESTDIVTDVIGADRLAAEPEATDTLIAQCGGLPLALGIAAANLRSNRSRRIVDEVEAMRQRGRLTQLQVAGDPQAAVRAAFDLSYARLDGSVARTFRLLGLMPRPEFAAAAVAAVCGSEIAEATHNLDMLLAANLVDAAGPGRFQLHDLLHDYAALRVHEVETVADLQVAEQRLWTHYLQGARSAADALYPGVPRLPVVTPSEETPDEAMPLTWLDDELPTLTALALRAQSRGNAAYAWHVADALGSYCAARGHGGEGLAIGEAALAAARSEGNRLAEARVLNMMGINHFAMSKFAHAEHCHREALTITHEIGDLPEQRTCLHYLGRVAEQIGPACQSVRYLEDALSLACTLEDVDSQALNTNYLGAAHLSDGRADLAVEHHLRALELAPDNESIRARVAEGLGNASLYRGEVAAAIEHYEESLRLAYRLGHRGLQTHAMIGLAEARCEAGYYAEAVAGAEEALRRGRELGEPRHEVGAAEVITTARFRSGERDGIVEAYEQTLARAREISFRFGEASVSTALAAALRGRGDPAAGVAVVEHALETMRESGMRGIEARVLVEAGRCSIDAGDADRALSHLERALKLARRSGSRLVEQSAVHERRRVPAPEPSPARR